MSQWEYKTGGSLDLLGRNAVGLLCFLAQHDYKQRFWHWTNIHQALGSCEALSLCARNSKLLSRVSRCCSSTSLRLSSHILPFLNAKNSCRYALIAAPIHMSTCLQVPRISILKLLFCCPARIVCLLPLKISSSPFLNHRFPQSTMTTFLQRVASMFIARASIVRYFPFFP